MVNTTAVKFLVKSMTILLLNLKCTAGPKFILLSAEITLCLLYLKNSLKKIKKFFLLLCNSNINEVIKTVQNFLLFFYEKILHSQKSTKKHQKHHKAPKAQKAPKSTKKKPSKNTKTQISEQK